MGYSIGTNLGNFNYFSNVVKGAKEWRPIMFDTPLPLDSSGYVTSLVTGQYAQIGISGAGNYVLTYNGEGTIYIKNKLVPNLGVIALNGSTTLQIRSVNPANHITNLSLVLEGSAGSVFTAEALSHLKPFKSYRFMDFMATNGTFYATQNPGGPESDKSDNGRWATRALPSDCFWRTELGVPLEIMVQLCNLTYCEPWFNIPTEADDDFVTQFATYVKNNLNSTLNIYVEYSNEAPWGGFGQKKWMKDRGREQGLSAISYFGKRTTQICQIFDLVFGNTKSRVKGVMAGQSSNYRVLQELLQYKWDPTPKTNAFYGIDGIAIAPYFGIKLDKKQLSTRHQFLIDAWNNDADKGMAKVFQSLEFGTGLPFGGSNATGDGAEGMIKSLEDVGKHVVLARDYGGLDLYCYEGGQGLSQLTTIEFRSDEITQQFLQAQMDPRMYTLYKKYFVKCFELGVKRFMHFSDAGPWGWFGSWGASNNFNQKTPKYDALVELIGSYTSPTPPPVQKTLSIIKTSDGKEVGSLPSLFTLTRTGDSSSILNVHYGLSGTAVLNVDYGDPNMGTVQFAVNQTSVTLSFPTLNDMIIDPSETIIVTLVVPTDYILNGSGSAIAVIIDSGVGPTTPPSIQPPTKPRSSRYNIQAPQ